jgi:hypothetical protein
MMRHPQIRGAISFLEKNTAEPSRFSAIANVSASRNFVSGWLVTSAF